jgi:site-specific DNA recombinase
VEFAFYGRVSTEDQQDPASSRAWQIARAQSLIEPHGGRVVDEFFDIGQSRSLPWKRRPQAALLLDALRRPDRGFAAVVIGEPARAFYGNQFGLTFPVFAHFGVGLWVPEVGGAVDPGSEAHDLVMSLYGGMSKGERTRIKVRVRTAMAAQAATEGRFLGGRPPYGYQLGDAGPHPNPGKAAMGARLHRLEPDPVAAPVVRRIFEEYVKGNGLMAIAEGLTADGIPSPSAHDPARNRHRLGSGGAWSKGAIRAILDNPRYTGRQVWNRQRRDEILIDVDDVALGHETRMRWNDRGDWVWSTDVVHDALIDVALFERVQEQRSLAARRQTTVRPRRKNTYVLSGLVRCGICERRMVAAWAHDRAYYRCRFPAEYADVQGRHPRSVNVREEAILPGLDRWLAKVFDPENLDATCAALASASEHAEADQARTAAAEAKIADCDRRLERYRAVLEAGTDAAVIGKWIAEVRAERIAAEQQLVDAAPAPPLTKLEIEALVASLQDMLGVLRRANPADKAAVYAGLGISLTYQPDGRVLVESRPPCTQERVGGGT